MLKKSLVVASLLATFNLQAQTVELQKGWNLIGTPASLTKSDIDSILTNTKAIFAFNPDSKKWKLALNPKLKIQKLPIFEKLDSIKEGEGFWVLADSKKSITINADIPQNNSISYKNGWQIISPLDNISINDIPNQDDLEIFWGYKDGEWLAFSYSPDILAKIQSLGFETIKDLKKYQGYWLLANQDGMISILDENQTSNTTDTDDTNTSDSNKEFIDTPPADDIPYFTVGSKVSDIEAAFNYARGFDKTIDKKLSLPPQDIWDKMSKEEQALYILNKERVDRGLKPFEAISNNVNKVASSYAEFLYKQKTIGHDLDGSPKDRLNRVKEIEQNHDFFKYSENIYVYGGSNDYLKNPLIRAIYVWLYKDKHPAVGEAWGHRALCLASGLKENFQKKVAEGLVGFGLKEGKEYANPTFKGKKSSIVVMNVFDPSENYSEENLTEVKLDLPKNSVDDRFVRENGTIFDTQTKLLWQDIDLKSLKSNEAVDFCENLTLNGKDDWRVANASELKTLFIQTQKVGVTTNLSKAPTGVDNSKDGFVVNPLGVEKFTQYNKKLGDLFTNLDENTLADTRCVSGEEQTQQSNDINLSTIKIQSVKDIEKLFNDAREKEGITTKLELPNDMVWDTISDFRLKVFYILNQERVARGYKPFEYLASYGGSGEFTRIKENKATLSDIANFYAIKHKAFYKLDEEGLKSALEDYLYKKYNNVPQTSQDSFGVKAVDWMGDLFDSKAKLVYDDKYYYVKSLYHWIYQDQNTREILFAKLNDNDNNAKEGVVGVGGSSDTPKIDGKKYYKHISTILVLDPNKNYDKLDKVADTSIINKYLPSNLISDNRFKVDLEKNVITDTKTSLMWQNGSITFVGERSYKDYADFEKDLKSYCEGLSFAGYDDWTAPKFSSSKEFHYETTRRGIIPKETSNMCIAELSIRDDLSKDSGFVKTFAGSVKYKGEPGDYFSNFWDHAASRCVRKAE
jgi:hypothetical protein